MMAISLILALLSPPQDDDLLRVFIQSSAWARILTAAHGRSVRVRDVRHVTCVGMEMRQMLCSWEQRSLWRWRQRSQWAEFRDSEDIRLLGDMTP